MSEPVKPLDIDTVHAFVLIADFGSFTRAAQALDTSQAAISLKLKRLEERLGYRLLERTPRHVRLTPVGEQFMQAARDLLGSVYARFSEGFATQDLVRVRRLLDELQDKRPA